MPNGVDGIRSTPLENSPATESGAVNTPRSTVFGQQVAMLPSPSSQIQDMQEEAGTMFQEMSFQKINSREAGQASKGRIQEILQKYLARVGEVSNAEKFEALTGHLKKLGTTSPRQLMQLIQEYTNDGEGSSSDSAWLLALESFFAGEPDFGELLGVVRQAKQELGSELADFCTRQFESFSGTEEVYNNILGRYSQDDFLSAVDAMISRLGLDINSEGSAADAQEIKNIVDCLYHLEVTRNTYFTFVEITRRLPQPEGN